MRDEDQRGIFIAVEIKTGNPADSFHPPDRKEGLNSLGCGDVLPPSLAAKYRMPDGILAL